MFKIENRINPLSIRFNSFDVLVHTNTRNLIHMETDCNQSIRIAQTSLFQDSMKKKKLTKSNSVLFIMVN